MIKQIRDIVNLFFLKLDFNIKKIYIIEENNNNYLIKLTIDRIKDSSIVIGPHGKNLESIKNILKLIIIKKINEKLIIHIDVNDYIKNKNNKLLQQIDEKIVTIKQTKKNIVLSSLSSYERKKIHSYIAKLVDNNIYTKSEGEGIDRKLYICYKENTNIKLSIDINGNDI